jgi:hypothetical protein
MNVVKKTGLMVYVLIVVLVLSLFSFASFNVDKPVLVGDYKVFGDTLVKSIVTTSKSSIPLGEQVYLERIFSDSSSVKERFFQTGDINRYIDSSGGEIEDSTTAKPLSGFRIDNKVSSSGFYNYVITQQGGGSTLSSVIPLFIDITPPISAELVSVAVPSDQVVIDNKYTTSTTFSLNLNVEAFSHVHYYSYDSNSEPPVFDLSSGTLEGATLKETETVGDESLYQVEGAGTLPIQIPDSTFNIAEGSCTTVVVVAHDIVNNAAVSNFTVCKDVTPPELVLAYPSDGSIDGDVEGQFYFEIEDNAQMNADSIEFNVEIDSPDSPMEKTEFTCASSEFECIVSDDLSNVRVEYTGNLVYGVYTVEITNAEDIMHNSMSAQYSFEKRSDVPRKLLYGLTNYNYFINEDMYYTNVSDLDLLLDFYLDQNVDVTFMTLEAKDVNTGSHLITSDIILGQNHLKAVEDDLNNKFTLHFKDIIPKSLADTIYGTRYSSKVHARKLIESDEYGASAKFNVTFIVDTIAPKISEQSLQHIIGYGSNNIQIDFVEDYVWYVNVKYSDEFTGDSHNENATLASPGGNGRISSANYVLDVETQVERGFDLTVMICDKARNCETSIVTVVADSTPPLVSHNYTNSSDWIQLPGGGFALNATDGTNEFASGVDYIRYCYVPQGSDECDPLTSGYEYAQPFYFSGDVDDTIMFIAVDNAGNPSDVGTVEVLIDNTPPVTTFLPEQGWYGTDMLVINLTEFDETSFVDKTLYCLVSGCDPCAVDNSKYEGFPLSFSEEGTKVFNFCSIDAAGNTQVVNLTHGLDRTPPQIFVLDVKAVDPQYAVIYDDESSFYMTGDDMVHITLGYEHDGYSLLNEVRVEGGVVSEVQGTPEEIMLSASIYSVENEIVIVAKDNAGNEQSISVFIRSDNEGPSVSFVEPNVLTFEPKIILSSNAEDMQPFMHIETDESATCVLTYIPNGLLGPVSEEFNTEDSIDHTLKLGFKLKDGTTDLTLSCVDIMGNAKTYDLGIVMDFTPPLITSWESVGGYMMYEDMPNVHAYSIIDNFVTQLRVTTDEPSTCRYSQVETMYENMESGFDEEGFVQELLTPVLELEDNKTYLYYINCEDAAGNVAKFSTTYGWIAVKLVVQLNLPITIINLKPNGATNKLPPALKLYWETRREATCMVDRNYDGETWPLIDMLKDAFDFGVSVDPLKEKASVYKFELPLEGEFEEAKEYTYDVTCYDPTDRLDPGFAQTSFVIDTTMEAPTILIPEQDGLVYNMSEIFVYGHCENGSQIRIFMNVYDPSETNFVDLTTCENGEYSSNDLVIRGGNNTIFVEASDDAGNIKHAQRTIYYNVLGPNVTISIDPKTGDTLNKLFNVTIMITELSSPTNETKRFSLYDSVFKIERMVPGENENIAEELDINFSSPTKTEYTTPEGLLIKETLDDVTHRVTFVPNAVPYKIAGIYIVKAIPRNFASEDGLPGQSVFELDPFAAAIEWILPVEKRIGKGGQPVTFKAYTEPVAQSITLTIEEFGYSPQVQNKRIIQITQINSFYDLEEKVQKGKFQIKENIAEGLNVYKATTLLFNHSATSPDKTIYYDVKGPSILQEYVKISSGGFESDKTPEELEELNLNDECFYGVGSNVLSQCLILDILEYSTLISSSGPAEGSLEIEGNEGNLFAASYSYFEEPFGDLRSCDVDVEVYESSEGLEQALTSFLGKYTTTYDGYSIYLDSELFVAIWVHKNVIVTVAGVHHSFIEIVDKYLKKYPSEMQGNAPSTGDDNDGLSTEFEEQFGLNLNLNDAFDDTDDDGAYNIVEHEAMTDPTDDDTDNDGMLDGFEIKYSNVLDPKVADAQNDSDKDGWNNVKEQIENTRPDVMDTDGDCGTENCIDSQDAFPLDPYKQTYS